MNDENNKVNKKTNKKTSKAKAKDGLHGIIGILLALAVISIVYSTAVIAMGTEGLLPIIMVIPQAALALTIVVWKFCK